MVVAGLPDVEIPIFAMTNFYNVKKIGSSKLLSSQFKREVRHLYY